MSNTSPPCTVRRAVADDAGPLARFAAAAFHDTYATHNTPADMASYAAASFGESQQRAEIESDGIIVLLAECAGEIVGYAMLRDGSVPAAIHDTDCIEIARLYAAKDRIGSGIGAMLMHACLAAAAARGQRTIWLGVWEHNPRAIAFYRRWQFADAGTLQFTLGADVQTDRLMVRPVPVEQ
jgi:ribosomal protein S18 acetylase RimI-like enzyme